MSDDLLACSPVAFSLVAIEDRDHGREVHVDEFLRDLVCNVARADEDGRGCDDGGEERDATANGGSRGEPASASTNCGSDCHFDEYSSKKQEQRGAERSKRTLWWDERSEGGRKFWQVEGDTYARENTLMLALG